MISEDFPGFPRICETLSLNCFCFDFHISAEQFYDRNKQEPGKNRNQQTMPCQNDGSSNEIIDQSQVSRTSCTLKILIKYEKFLVKEYPNFEGSLAGGYFRMGLKKYTS